MTHSERTLSNQVVPEFLTGGGEMGRRIQEFNWESTELGPLEKWPQSLKTCVRIMLTSRQPIWIGWGPNLLKMYNDAYIDIVGGKHPRALGTPASIVWKDIWDDIAPMLRTVMEEDKGTYVESQLLIMERNGYPEETYYTFSYTPIPGDDGKTAGMFCANTDDTKRIIHARQLKTLSTLAKRLLDCRTEAAVYNTTINVLEENPFDFPFTLIRTISGDKAELAASSALGSSSPLVVPEIDLKSETPVAQIIRTAFDTKEPQVFSGISKKIGAMPQGAWKNAPEQAIVIPILLSGNTQPAGVITFGLNPFRTFDDEYRSFYSLITDQITTSIVEVQSQEAERKRIEALAELDKAKSIFFSNISHEFRTPLTLLLGPTEEVINSGQLSAENKSALELALRNGYRMQKLVNNLLDFSRAEAGKLAGHFRKVNIVDITRELTALFQPVIENSGLTFSFKADKITDDIYVDTDMWEKIVTNLLSNAFKYTEKGNISVVLEKADEHVSLRVCDTGVGIPDNHLDKIFDRFHRVEKSGGRSQEGTGIGLAMVKELVKVHKGSINVQSQSGEGSCFVVEIPTGKKHLLHEHVDETGEATTQKKSNSLVEEAKKWEAQKEVHEEPLVDTKTGQPKILLVDDNADMREYVAKVLNEKFELKLAVDGQEALDKLNAFRPDLIITDIMMPKVDGFELLRRLRDNPETRHIPIIFLSARAGEEAKIEGLQAGVDDYLIKPFSSKELLVRAEANIRISKTRAAAEQNLRLTLMQAPVAITLLKGKTHRIEVANQFALDLWGRKANEVMDRPLLEALPEVAEQGFGKLLDSVLNTGTPYYGYETPLTLTRFGKSEFIYLNFIYEPFRNETGDIEGVLGLGVDVTPLVIARKKTEENEKQLQVMANAMPQLVWVADEKGEVTYFNDRIGEFASADRLSNGRWSWEGMVHPDDLVHTHKNWEEALKTGHTLVTEHRFKLKDGSYRWHLTRAIAQKDEQGKVIKWFGTTTDVNDAKEETDKLEVQVKNRTQQLEQVNQALKTSNDDLLQFAHVASHDLKEPVRKIKTFTGRVLADAHGLEEREKNFLHKVMHAAERMNAMIEGVLNYSTLNASRQQIEKIDLEETIKNVESDLEVVIQHKNATIELAGKFAEIEGAPVLIHQLFYNLLNNSLKFSKPDIPPYIKISSHIFQENNQSFTEISVEDNGIGFDPEYSNVIFNTFTRLNSKDQFEGTGIGLALCEKIVARHQGTITAEGKKDEGACFRVTLPLAQNNQNV